MTEKSHAGLGYSICPICYTKHDEVVLLDTRLRDSLERDNFMGWELCPEHKAMKEEFLGMVEVSNNCAGPNLKPENAQPTGRVAHVKRSVVSKIFNVTVPDDMPFVYVEVGVVARLREMQPKDDAPCE